MKKFLKGAAAVVAVLALIWVIGRYGWRLGGFRFCMGSGIESISVADASVEIKGFYPGSFPKGYVGCVTKQEGSTLWLGVRYDPVFGVFETGNFAVTVPLQEPVDAIYLAGGENAILIWDRNTDPMEMTEGFFLSREFTVQIVNQTTDAVTGLGIAWMLGDTVFNSSGMENGTFLEPNSVISFVLGKEELPEHANLESFGFRFDVMGADGEWAPAAEEHFPLELGKDRMYELTGTDGSYVLTRVVDESGTSQENAS